MCATWICYTAACERVSTKKKTRECDAIMCTLILVSQLAISTSQEWGATQRSTAWACIKITMVLSPPPRRTTLSDPKDKLQLNRYSCCWWVLPTDMPLIIHNARYCLHRSRKPLHRLAVKNDDGPKKSRLAAKRPWNVKTWQ